MSLPAVEVRSMIDRIVAGESVRAVTIDRSLCVDFYDSIAADPLLSRYYAAAQRAKADLLADDIHVIADTEPDVARARLKCENIRWHVAKLDPTRFGDRIELNVNHTVDLSAAIRDGEQRALPRVITGQVIEPDEDFDIFS